MPPSHLRLAAFAVSWITALAATTASAQVEIRPHLMKDQVLRYEFHQTNNANVKAEGQSIESSNTLTIGFTWKVGEVATDGGATVTQTVDYVRAEIKNAMQTVTYDSRTETADGPGAEALKDLYSKAIGAEYTLQLDSRGAITSVKIPESVTTAVQGTQFASAADGGSFFTETGVKNLLGQVMPTLPDTAVKAGDTWKKALSLPAGPIQMNLDTTYTLASIEEGAATIEAKVDTRIEPAPSAQIKVETRAQAGMATFHMAKDGTLADSNLKQSFDLQIEVMEQKIEQKVSLDAKLTTRPAA